MKPDNKIKFGAVILLLIAFFIILNLTPGKDGVRSFFYSVSLPVQKSLWRAGAGVSEFFSTVWQLKNLKSENEQLRLKNQELSTRVVQLLDYGKENQTLRDALNLGLAKEFKMVLSQVVSKDAGQDIIVINRGEKDGMAPDMPVITKEKVLVGKIIEANKRFSKVRLITDKASSFDVKILDSNVEGVFRGAGNFSAVLDLIPRQANIKEQDQILTSALGGVFPAGLLAGTIAKIDKKDTESFQKAEIRPAFTSEDLDNLFVIVNYNF